MNKLFMHIKKQILIYLIAVGMMSFSIVSPASLIPTGNDAFYYKLGGGQAIPIPAFIDQQSLPLDVKGELGLGYNCGVFNPIASIMHSLNGEHLKNSFMNIKAQIIQNATSAILEWPMYEISRANPSLYNLMTNNIFGAKDDVSLSTKSCQVMQNEIAQGKNPYHDWGQISVGNDWKHYMSFDNGNFLANANASLPNGLDPTDINEVKDQVNKDNGKNGVSWVNGVNTGRSGLYAGGEDQPPILVLNDTAIAGYNVIIGNGRAYNDTSAPPKTTQDEHLIEVFPTPKEAANWITHVLGNAKVTTYSGGDKASTPGVGLLPDVQNLSQQIGKKLADLISGQEEINLNHLKEVSAPSVMINKSVIDNIRLQTPVNQSIFAGKLAQMIAAAKIVDKAQIALHILQSGSEVPSIFANKAAQDMINQSINRLNQALKQFVFNVQLNQLVSSPIAQLMADMQAQQASNTSIQANTKPAQSFLNGAIKQDDNKEAK